MKQLGDYQVCLGCQNLQVPQRTKLIPIENKRLIKDNYWSSVNRIPRSLHDGKTSSLALIRIMVIQFVILLPFLRALL